MSKLDKYDEQLMRLMNELADSLAQADESEMLEEARNDEANLLNEAQEISGVLDAAGRQYVQRKLRESRLAYDAAISQMKDAYYDLPGTAVDRKRLLQFALERQPGLEPALITAQFREFSDLTDEDVLGLLRQLKELGLLDVPAEPTGK